MATDSEQASDLSLLKSVASARRSASEIDRFDWAARRRKQRRRRGALLAMVSQFRGSISSPAAIAIASCAR